MQPRIMISNDTSHGLAAKANVANNRVGIERRSNADFGSSESYAANMRSTFRRGLCSVVQPAFERRLAFT
jgi:hypothetical protein